ncbi:hypothetical protein Cgig2_002059 [Carnegiea gigantea]|uniref:Uncharacterized protein n=1 Tax=Carnegiea gigantea TaxID=171969 RepID=A0A9Q1GVY8_9CARY|nr:hypothetical protein Cgig2_002059 [Carnegiea gigantea]
MLLLIVLFPFSLRAAVKWANQTETKECIVNSLAKQHLRDLFKMITFMDKITSERCYLHIQPSENDVNGEETKLPLRNRVTFLCKSDCARGPPILPWWSTENLKTDKTDAGCIHPDTFSVASFMASSVGYCLPTAILGSIYKGLNEISRSCHPGRGGGYFPAHFLYAWLAKNFDVCELVGEAFSSPGMVKFGDIGQAKSFQLEEAKELIGSKRGFRWHSSIINRLKETLVDDDKLSRDDFAYFMFISSTCSPHASDSKRKRSDLLDTNTSKDEGKLGSKPKLKIVCSGKPLEPSVPLMGDGSSRVTIQGADVVILVTPIPGIPIQSVAPLLQDEIPIGVFKPTTERVIELPPEGAENIMDILNSEPNPTEYMGESDNVNFKEELAHVESIRRVNAPSLVPHPQRPLRAPQGRISVFNAEAVIKEPLCHYSSKRCRLTPLESKVEGLIKQACDFKDLQQSYSDRTFAEEHDTCRMEVQGKLDEASRRLNTEGGHYEVTTAVLKHVELRHQKLLKELQLLEEQRKDLSSQVAASEHLLHEAKREVINLQGQIDILNATEVMDVATKASLEKAETYINESFEDLKNFQWDP